MIDIEGGGTPALTHYVSVIRSDLRLLHWFIEQKAKKDGMKKNVHFLKSEKISLRSIQLYSHRSSELGTRVGWAVE